jgi:hypothetical protein
MFDILRGQTVPFPFVIRGFQSDNGSEYVNKLDKLLVEFTKSRSAQNQRQCARRCTGYAALDFLRMGRHDHSLRNHWGRAASK